MTRTTQYPAPNGDATIGSLPLEPGDVTHTSETPALDTPPPTEHRVLLDYTLCQTPDGAACIRIVGPPTMAAAQAIRLGQQLVALGTLVGEQRSLTGNTE